MTATAKPDARSYVRQAQLPPVPAAAAQPRGEETPLESGKKQAAVVGSDVVAFVEGVTAEHREAIANSALLAQLVATTKVPDRKQVYDWYKEYFKVLENIGWTTQEVGFAEYTEKANGLEAHEAILQVAATLLGAAPTALALVTTTINALKEVNEGSSWLTIFSRNAEHAETAHFQVTLVDREPAGPFLVKVMAFGLKAKTVVTRVLFFTIRKDEANLKHYAGTVTINAGVLDELRGDLEAKLKGHAKSYIAALPPFSV